MTNSDSPQAQNDATHQIMAEKAMARLYNFGEGNGLAKDDIQLLLSTEDTYAIHGTLTLTPRFSSKINFYSGTIKKGKDAKTFPSFTAMQADIAERKKTFQKGGTWFPDAVTEIQHTKDHGWGLEEAEVTFPDQDLRLAATETCPSCNGAGQHTCQKCRGQKSTLCIYCHGQKEEECHNCFGKGVDPTNPHNQCPHCHGRRYAPCRYCQGTGLQVCPQCQGKGGTLCPECKGTGKITQEVIVSAGATMTFQLDRFAETPSGLLRMTDRIGIGNLVKGHADIKMRPLDPMEEKTIIKLDAIIPYAEIKTRFFGRPTLISVFGKRNILSGVPPFLDECTKHARAALTDAAANKGSLDTALGARMIRDALRNTLMGKTHPDDLRRIYPIGLSAETATEIMKNISKALRNATRKSRVLLAGGVTAVGAGIFAALFLTPLWATLTASLPTYGKYGVLIAPPAIVLGIAYGILQYFTSHMLRRSHPDMPINASQKIGLTGYATISGLFIFYVAIILATQRF